MTSKPSVVSLAALGLGVLAALGGGASPAAKTAAPPTSTEDIPPIIFNNCTSCHRPGENAPFTLMTYDEVRPRARQIANATKTRQMPPWKAGARGFALQNDRPLSARRSGG